MFPSLSSSLCHVICGLVQMQSPCSPISMFPSPMFPSLYVPRSYVPRHLCSLLLYVPRSLCSPVLYVPQSYVPQSLMFPGPMFPGIYVPHYLCSPASMFPRPMFPSIYGSQYLCSPVPIFLISHNKRLRDAESVISAIFTLSSVLMSVHPFKVFTIAW